MKAIRYCFFLFILFNNCETQVNNNIRVLIKGSVVDENNIPISDAKIEVLTDANNIGASTALLGEGFSDAEGNFSVTSLFGKNELFYITINKNEFFSEYSYQTNTKEFIPNDLIFNLQVIELKRISNFTYNITSESGMSNTISYNFNYILPQCFEVFDNDILNEDQSFCFESNNINRILDINNPNDINRLLKVPLNSVITFTYTINEGNENTELITIDSTEYVFDFSY